MIFHIDYFMICVQFVKVDKTNNLSVYKQFVINVKDYFDEPTNKGNHVHLKNANYKIAHALNCFLNKKYVKKS